MGNRNRKKICRLSKSQCLRFEPLELRLQFAVDYQFLEADFFPIPESEFLASIGPAIAWPVNEFHPTSALELNSIDELYADTDPVLHFGFSAPYLTRSLNSSTSLSEFLRGTVPSNLDNSMLTDEVWFLENVEQPLALDVSTPIVDFTDGIFFTDFEKPFHQTIQHALEFDDLDWIGFTVPLQDESVSFGPISESWIAPTTLVRRVNIQGVMINESSIRLSQNRSSSNFELGQTSTFQVVGELLNSKPHVSYSHSLSREIVGQVAGRSILPPSSQGIDHAENTLDVQSSLELELNGQLPVERPTYGNSRTSRSQASPNLGVVPPELASSKTTNAVLTMNMLPLGMLPIGSEPVSGPACSSQDYAGKQHFIVQTALICESFNTGGVCYEQSENVINDKTLESEDFDHAAPNRSLEIVAAGFVLLVAKTQFRLPKPLRSYWEKCIARFKQPLHERLSRIVKTE